MKKELLAQPQAFSFFQAVRILAHAGSAEGAQVGQDAEPTAEPIRFRATRSHNFASADVEKVSPRSNRNPAEGPPALDVFVNFIGLFGPQGALPRQYTKQLVRGNDSAKDHLRDFLDLFDHRITSLFYRAWAKNRFTVEYERWRAANARQSRDLFSHALLSLVGMGGSGLADRMSFHDDVLAYFGGLFAHHPRSASALQAVLREWVGAPVEVEQLRGCWLLLEREEQLRMGLGSAGGLGSCVLGARVWSAESRIRIRIGPVSFAEFRRLSPGGTLLTELAELTRTYCGVVLDFEVQVVLQAKETPASLLCRKGGCRLGIDTWLITKRPINDPEDAIFRPTGWPCSTTSA